MSHALLCNRIFSAIAVVILAAMSTGCASFRIDASLAPTGRPIPAPVTFNLTDVRYVVLTNMAQDALSPFASYPITRASLSDDMMNVAMKLYPKTFSKAPDAVPLQVTITGINNEAGVDDGAACVSCLTLTLIPLRSTDKETYSVETRSSIPAANQALARPVTFSRTDVSWLSILPTGWIPVPAGAGERAWGMDSGIATAKEITFKSCVEAIAANLRRVKPEAWSASVPATRQKESDTPAPAVPRKSDSALPPPPVL